MNNKGGRPEDFILEHFLEVLKDGKHAQCKKCNISIVARFCEF